MPTAAPVDARGTPPPPPDDLFLRACYRLPTPRTPLWIMRQAGRYLPEYRAVRAATDFLTLCRTPELAAQVTVQPVDIVGVDAAIIFSDILLIPEAMGMRLVVAEGKGGPRFPEPLGGRDDIDRLADPDPGRELRYVLDALRLARRELRGRVPLIGFAGSPWTLACYMLQGSGSAGFPRALEFVRGSPGDAHRLLGRLARAVAAHLSAQAEAGAQALQIFDTWGGLLTPVEFERFSLRYIAEIVSSLPTSSTPVIVFCRGCGHALERIAATGCQTVGLDGAADIGAARRAVGSSVSLQGNLDPALLLRDPGTFLSRAGEILAAYGSGPGHIFNLGHGILPDTPVDHVRELVRFVRSESIRYHPQQP